LRHQFLVRQPAMGESAEDRGFRTLDQGVETGFAAEVETQRQEVEETAGERRADHQILARTIAGELRRKGREQCHEGRRTLPESERAERLGEVRGEIEAMASTASARFSRSRRAEPVDRQLDLVGRARELASPPGQLVLEDR